MAATMAQFRVWKVIKLGISKDTRSLASHLKRGGTRITHWSEDILRASEFKVDSELEVRLVVQSVAELGFREGATFEEIRGRATECGLELCPAEVGPQLRLQYQDQSAGERLLIAMEPATDSDGNPGIFCVGHGDGEMWLDTFRGYPNDFWCPDRRFVFVLPR